LRDWNEWIKQLISCFRCEAGKLSPEQKLRISNLDDLSFPCQVDVVWLQNSQIELDYQYLIFQHFEDRPDLEVFVHGPVPFSKAISEFDGILAHEKWGRPLSPDEPYYVEDGDRTLRRILAGRFLSALDGLRDYVIQSAFAEVAPTPSIAQRTWLTRHSFTWIAHGDIRSIEPTVIVTKTVEDAAKRVPQTDTQPTPKPLLTAYGTFFYPAIWVGEMPKRTFEEKARRRHAFNTAKKTFTFNCSGLQTVVREDGLIAIAAGSKAKALDMLNVIMGMAVISGLPSFAVREPEVGEIALDAETLEVRNWTMSLVSDRTRLGTWFGGDTVDRLPVSRSIVSEDDLQHLFKNADAVYRDTGMKGLLLFLLEGYTHYQASEYPQSFAMSWTVVEKYIASLWDDFLNDRTVSGGRRRKLKKGLQWTTDHVLEALELAGALDSIRYASFMSLKGKRNKLLHEGQIVTKEDAQECLTTAQQIVVNAAQKLGAVHAMLPQTKLLGLQD
jgi:hypothetical protein